MYNWVNGLQSIRTQLLSTHHGWTIPLAASKSLLKKKSMARLASVNAISSVMSPLVGKGIREVLKLNPNSKLYGLTNTHLFPDVFRAVGAV